MSRNNLSTEFKNRHSAILANGPIGKNNQLADLLNQGNLNIIDTAVELDFLRKHVNDSIDTIIECNELLKGVFQDLRTLQKLDHDPVQTQVINNAINKLELLHAQQEANAEQSNTFRPR